MPALNLRFAFKLFITVLVLVGAIVGIHTYQAQRIPNALKRQAERADAAGKTDAAIRYLRQYLEFKPKDVAVRVELAEKLMSRGAHPQELFHAYDRILRVDSNHTETRKAAIAVCLRLGRYTDAAEHAEKYLALVPADTEAWLDLARANVALAKTDAAVSAFEGAIKVAPQSAPAYLKYISYLMGEANRPDEAKTVVDRCVAALPDKPEPYLARARWALAKPEAAITNSIIADVNKTLSLAPNHADALLLKADCLQRMQDVPGAKECLISGMKAHPADGRFPRRLAWVEVHRGSIASAVTILEDGMKTATTGTDDLLIPLGDLLVQLGETDRAEAIAKRMDNRRTTLGTLQAKYLRARMMMRAMDYSSAITTLTSIRTEGATAPGLEAQSNLLLAICFRALGERDKERESLKLILDRDPRNNAARVALAQSYLNAGQFVDAGREYEEAARSPYASSHTISIAIKLRALKYRNNARAEDWAGLDRAALALQNKVGSNSSEPAQLRADLAKYRGQSATAWAILRQEVVKHPGDTALWTELITTTANTAGIAAAFQTFDEALALAGDNADLRALKSTLAAIDPAQLRPLETIEDTVVETWSEAEREKHWIGIVDAADIAGNLTVLAKAYTKLAELKNEGQFWFLAYEAALTAKDNVIQSRCLSELNTLGKPAEPFLALCQILNPQITSKADFAKALDSFLTNSDACRVLATIKTDTGATKLYERAVQLDPTGLNAMKALLTHYAKTNEELKLKQTIQRLHQDPRWVGAPLQRVIFSTLRLSDAANAERIIAIAASVAPAGAEGFTWLGDCNRIANQPAKATAMYAQAVATSKNPDDWLRLAMVSNDKVTVRDAAAVALSPTANAAFLSALCAVDKSVLKVSSTPEEQLALVQARVSLELTRNARPQAIAVLDQFLNAPDLRNADKAWARRALGLMLADGGTPEERKRAYTILVSGDAAGTTATDQRTTAAVVAGLSRYLDGSERATALGFSIKLLENVIAAEKNPRDQFLLYQVLKAQGDAASLAKAEGILAELNTKHPNTDYQLAALEDSPAKGSVFAEQLQAVANTDARVAMALASYELRSGKHTQAFARIQDFLRTDNGTTDATAKATRVVTLLENTLRKVPLTPEVQTKVTEMAVNTYESMVHVRQEAVPAAASLLAKNNQPADAFAFVEKHGQKLPLRLKAAAGVAIARAVAITPAQQARVQEWVEASRKEEPNSTAVKLTYAEWLAARGDNSQAEAVYLALLKTEPTNPHALNNLAWLLAPYPERSAQALDYIERAARELGYTPELLDTRARIRIASRQSELAAADATLALTREKTPLRYFHLALAKQSMTPPQGEEARAAYKNAKQTGLAPHMVHPVDLPALRSFDAGQ